MSFGPSLRQKSPLGGLLVIVVRSQRKILSGDRTVFERSNHCDERGVKRISVVVDARRVDVQHPGCTLGVDA